MDRVNLTLTRLELAALFVAMNVVRAHNPELLRNISSLDSIAEKVSSAYMAMINKMDLEDSADGVM